eukprot:1381427-Alexandrium_andersonii.AAC.1
MLAHALGIAPGSTRSIRYSALHFSRIITCHSSRPWSSYVAKQTYSDSRRGLLVLLLAPGGSGGAGSPPGSCMGFVVRGLALA